MIEIDSLSLNGTDLAAPPLVLLESLLFVASGPVSPARLAAALDISPAAVGELLRELEADFVHRSFGKEEVSFLLGC